MSQITTYITNHNNTRNIRCFICGSKWEEHYVSITLGIYGHSEYGSLCPRCLSISPRETAQQLKINSKHVHSELEKLKEVLQTSHTNQTDDFQKEVNPLRKQTEQLRRTLYQNMYVATLLKEKVKELIVGVESEILESIHLIYESRRLLSKDAGQTKEISTPQLNSILEEAMLNAKSISLLADHFPQTNSWQLTVENVIKIERECFYKRYALEESDICLVVDKRYQDYFAQSPPAR